MPDTEIDRDLLAAIGGRVIYVRGHHPLVLENPRSIWLVAAGSAAVLTSRVDRGLAVGRRRMVFRAAPGTPLFAVSDEHQSSSSRVIVLSIDPLTLYEIPLDRIEEAMALVGVPLVNAIEGWVENLSGFCASGLLPPFSETLPEHGKFAIPPGITLRPPRETVRWVQLDQGVLQLLGMPALSLSELPHFMPLGSSIWAKTEGPVRLLVRQKDALEAEDENQLLQGLASFNRLFQARLQQLEASDYENELQRLSDRSRRERQAVESAVGSMANVLNPGIAASAAEGGLLGAVRLVGEALGMKVRAPRQSEVQGASRHPIEGIARASHFRFRNVLLSGEWWRSDCGPLVGEIDQVRRPVALLRTESRGYEIVDPDTGNRARVDAETAAALSPQAFMLYRRLPDEARKPRDLLRFALRGRIGDVAFVLSLALLTTLLGMITPLATALIMDRAIPDANERLLLEVGLALLAAAFGVALFGLAQSFISIRMSVAVDADTQSAVWDRLLNLRMAFFKRFSSGDLLERAMSVSEVTQEFNGQTLRTLFASGMALLNLALLFYYSPKLASLAFGLGLTVAVASAVTGLFIRRYYRELMELQGSFFGLVVQMVSSVSKIRVAGAQRRAFALWAERYSEQLDLMLRAQRGEDYITVLNQAVPVLSSILLFWFGVSLLGASPTNAQGLLAQVSSQGPVLSVGIFLAFNAAMGTFLGGITSLSQTVLDTLDTLAKARRIQPLLDAEPEVDDSRADPGRLEGELELTHVDFRYNEEGERILKDVSLKVIPGQFVAFTGPSGSGKSTLFRLLLGFETPDAGTIRYDGRDLASLDVTAVRRQMGVVLQGGRINEGSIFDNIASAAPLSLDQVWEAVEDAGFGDDVRQMPMGLHTVISEGGTNLSGGQRQRLLIARALAMHPKILLLDEATSALDNQTQATVSASLERRKVTRIVIAHRLSTIRNADRIYVLDRGTVVESGSFDELLRNNRLFASMIARQVA